MKLHSAPYPHHFAVLNPEGINTFGIRNLLKKNGGILSSSKKWIFPLDMQALERLRSALINARYEVTFDVGLLQELNRSHNGEVVFPFRPYPYQVEGTKWLMSQRGAILIDEMGLGKTKQSIDAAANLKRSAVIVVCPVSLIDNWEREISMNAPGEIVYKVTGDVLERLHSIDCFARDKEDGKKPWLILNYEKIRLKTGKEPSAETMAILKASTKAIVICDEAHRLKNAKAQCSAAVRSMLPDRIWLLTGTPVANEPADVWHLVRLVRPGLLGWYWSHFEQYFVVRDRYGAIASYNNLSEIRDTFARVSMGRKKSAVKAELPDKIFMQRTVELNPSENSAYRQMQKTMTAWLRDVAGKMEPIIAQEFTARFVRLRQLADGFGSNSAGEGAIWCSEHPTKIMESVAVWEDAGRPKLVVWCSFRELIKRVVHEFENVGAKVFQIHGSVSPNRRQDIVDQWSDLDAAVLVGQINTAGIGLNLQAGNFQIFLDPPQTPMERLQAIDRQHRIGQTSAVTVVDILAKKTVDTIIHRRLALKMTEADLVTETSFRHELMQAYMEENEIAVGAT